MKHLASSSNIVLKEKENTMDMTAIAIVAIIAWMIVSIFEANKKGQKKQKESEQERNEYSKEIEQLKARVEVLEKIVTDDQFTLNQEFANLNKDNIP